MVRDGDRSIRLAELVAVLSLGTDLGLGQPLEHVLRQTLIALRLAERLGLGEEDRRVVYYTALLAYVGCHVDATEQARWLGDDLAAKEDYRLIDFDGPLTDARYLVGHLGAGRPPLERLRLGFAFLTGEGRRALDAMFDNHWRATDGLAEALGLDQAVRDSLAQTFERWDGRGMLRLRGDEARLTARLIVLADVVEIFHRRGGVAGAVAAARERRGTAMDPDLVDLLCADAEAVLGGLADVVAWDAVIAAEPSLGRRLAGGELEGALEAIADFVDLKAPWLLGHSRRVAGLAARAAAALGLPEEDARTCRRAGLLHELGRLGVSSAIWDRPGPLPPAQWERVRLHPYLTERMLSSAPALAPAGAVAGRHRERLDGSGYPRGLPGDVLTAADRLLAAADVFAALGEDRPHRPAHADPARELRREVRAGRLDGDAADAVLAAAGHRVPRRREGPAGLTAREIEVLRLVAGGLTTREIAERLVISPRTAGNHVQHIYAKAGIANRAQASVFAMRHGLLATAGT